jgi:acyl-coenzyme A synthetase/AMP-(fatty) acid ligase
VRSAFVVGIPDPVRGQNVAAAVILGAGSQLGADVLRERLRAELRPTQLPVISSSTAMARSPSQTRERSTRRSSP